MRKNEDVYCVFLPLVLIFSRSFNLLTVTVNVQSLLYFHCRSKHALIRAVTKASECVVAHPAVYCSKVKDWASSRCFVFATFINAPSACTHVMLSCHNCSTCTVSFLHDFLSSKHFLDRCLNLWSAFVQLVHFMKSAAYCSLLLPKNVLQMNSEPAFLQSLSKKHSLLHYLTPSRTPHRSSGQPGSAQPINIHQK